MALKYLVDTTAVRLGTGAWLTPWQFLSPLLGTRWAATEAAGLGLQWFLILWALPFAWVGVSMSLRRAASAGIAPWWGMLFFVPGLNYVLMLALALAPDRAPEAWARAVVGPEGRREDAEARVRVAAAVRGLMVGMAVTLVLLVVGFFVTFSYGSSLFLGAPVAVGAASGFSYNRSRTMGAGESIAVGLVAVALAMGFALIFGLEGAVCLVMAAPIAFGGAVVGAILGRSIALASYRSVAALFVVAAAVPLLGWAENRVEGSAGARPIFEVTTTTLVEADPQQVWLSVIGFPRLPEPEWLLFRLGIAYPMGATIDGEGVGAIRRCEFSTGPFIEPVTAWAPGRLLAFDVAENPNSMREWSPYGELVTAHLDSGFRAVRGEFRLVPAGEGRTLLSGTTWYRLELAPRLYWKLWADWIVHRVHERVLAHVKELAS